MSKESTLTQSQKDSIEIEKFIFHIIAVDNENPTYLDEVVLTTEQKIFFKNRIAEVAEGTQYTFVDKEHNILAGLCTNLASSEQNFIDKSKTISNDFKSHHSGNMTDGAFIITTFKMLNSDDSSISLIALIKMDQKKVLEYELEVTEEGRKAKMREIADSFIESKEAVQKVAIIDITETFSWDILAKERKKTEGIAEYFKKFLNAQMKDTPSSLTKKTISEVNKWAKVHTDSLKDIPEINDKTSDYASYVKSRAIDFINANDGITFNAENFITHIFNLEQVTDESKEKILKLHNDMKEHLTNTGIYGQVFIPRPNSITKTIARTKKRTEEGVVIEWQGNPEDKGVKIDVIDGKKRITILTAQLEDLEK